MYPRRLAGATWPPTPDYGAIRRESSYEPIELCGDVLVVGTSVAIVVRDEGNCVCELVRAARIVRSGHRLYSKVFTASAAQTVPT